MTSSKGNIFRVTVCGIHQSPVNSPHKGQWHRTLMFSLICVWISAWINNCESGDLWRHHAHYDVIVMQRHHPICHDHQCRVHSGYGLSHRQMAYCIVTLSLIGWAHTWNDLCSELWAVNVIIFWWDYFHSSINCLIWLTEVLMLHSFREYNHEYKHDKHEGPTKHLKITATTMAFELSTDVLSVTFIIKTNLPNETFQNMMKTLTMLRQ